MLRTKVTKQDDSQQDSSYFEGYFARLKTLCSWTPLRQSIHLRITENKEFLRVPPSRSVVEEECLRPGQIELHLHMGRVFCLTLQGETGMMAFLSNTSVQKTKMRFILWFVKDHTIFSRQKIVPISWFNLQIVTDSHCALVRNPGQGHFWFHSTACVKPY